MVSNPTITDADLVHIEAQLQKTIALDYGDYIPDWMADTIRSLSAEVRRLRELVSIQTEILDMYGAGVRSALAPDDTPDEQRRAPHERG